MKKGFVFAFTAGGFIAGGVVSLFMFAHFILPAASNYYMTDPHYIKLDDRSEPYLYSSIADRSYVGNLYLRHPFLVYKREEGIHILSDLAARGYTPAANNLFQYTLDDTKNRLPNKNNVLNAYKWARITAQQGDLMALFALLKLYNLADYKDVTSDIKLMEKFALNTPLHGAAAYLADYHKKNNNPQKAAHWAQVAADIKASPFTDPTCTTITPWRGY